MTDANSYYLEKVITDNNLEGFKDVFWNLGQIVAWVATRNPFPVDALSDSTKDLATRPHSLPAGFPSHAVEFADRCFDENLARVEPPFKSGDDVRTAVLRSFQSGLLTASGQRRGCFDRESIAPLEWVDLTMDESLKGGMTLRHRDGFFEAWTDVRVKGDDVISAFLMPRLPHAAPDKGGRPAEYDWGAVKEYALGLVQQHGVPGRDNRRLPNKSQLTEAILNEWASREIQLAEPTVRKYVDKWLKEL